jgi:hypothetical protein
MRKALVTVTDKRYHKGTIVLLYSFLKYHPNFKGDLVVIHDRLPDQIQKK